jgi:putative flippase GtrA
VSGWITARMTYRCSVLQRGFSHLRALSNEGVKFLFVGGLGYIVDVSTFNLLRFAGGEGPLFDRPLTAKIISVVLATLVTYTGNRHWTWRHRQRTGFAREYLLFFVLNGVALGIAVATLAISHYVLGFTSPLADNIAANGIGLALGTAFRFWSYRRWVFRAPSSAATPATTPMQNSVSSTQSDDLRIG